MGCSLKIRLFITPILGLKGRCRSQTVNCQLSTVNCLLGGSDDFSGLCKMMSCLSSVIQAIPDKT
ncbi:MAG: hypothetical protein JGK08_14310 [Microcoleus sp. PH2017_04_SCI_O_A]|nr:hypothetical protein [Microcoleus sp. PH2017_04_SCI_O_A]